MTAIAATRIEALTGIRGLAALWVALYHATGSLTQRDVLPPLFQQLLANGWLAVDLFFVLSGFVIAYVHAKDFPRWSVSAYRDFLLLRIARIYPVHLVVVFLWLPIVVAASILGIVEASDGFRQNYNAPTFVYALTLTNGWGIPGSEGWNLPSWSVGSEWFAYLTFPIWALTVCRIRSAVVLLLIPIAIIGAMYWRAFTFNDGVGYMPAGSWFLTRVVSAFVIGCCLHGLFRLSRSHLAYDWASFGCLALLIALALGGFGPIWDGVYVAVFAALVFCVARSVSFVSQFLACRPMVWLGTVSYSLYLIHALVIVAVAKGGTALGLNPSSLGPALVLLGIFLVLSLVAADVLQRCVEQPARIFLRRRWLHAKG